MPNRPPVERACAHPMPRLTEIPVEDFRIVQPFPTIRVPVQREHVKAPREYSTLVKQADTVSV